LPEQRKEPWGLVLFDIDGTLCLSGGAGARALERALLELLGVSRGLSGITLDGATDPAIMRAIFAAQSLDFDAALSERVLARYLELLPEELQTGNGYQLMPGVAELLEQLMAEDIAIGLCTGNLVQGARAKLSHGGIWDPFAPPHFGGGFGSDAEERHEIVRVAIARAETHLARSLAPRDVLIVGDTPRDVAAALAVGVPCLGVATGRSSEAQLAEAGATYTSATLEGPGVLSLLLPGRV
jgi:phosphoglycolate phosphatase-like HAD superfamily hydrolase